MSTQHSSMVIVIPNYIRKVKLSEKQLPIYYEFKDGYIKAKNKLIPDRYLSEEGLKNKILNEGKTNAGDLKQGYDLGVFRNNKYIGQFASKDEDRYYLINSNNERIISNPRRVGTPRLMVINGQSIYSGALKEHARGTIMDAIKSSFAPYLQNTPKITEYPIRIRCYLYDTVKNEFDNSKDLEAEGIRWDIGNRMYPYMKAFADLLTIGGKFKGVTIDKILEDDDRLHLVEDGGCVFMPIEKSENRKLVFVIGKIGEDFNKAIEPYEKEQLWLITNNKYYKDGTR